MQGVNSNAFSDFIDNAKQNGLGNAISNYFNIGSLVTGKSDEKAQTLSRVQEIKDISDNISSTVQDAVISGAEAIGASGEVVEAIGDVTTVSGTVVTPFAPEVGIPMVEAGTIISGAGVVMQIGESAVKGNFKEVASKVIVELVPGEMGKPLRNGVDKMDISSVSKQIVKQQIGTGELIIEKAIDEKINGSN